MHTTAPNTAQKIAPQSTQSTAAPTSAPKIIALIPARSGSKRIPHKNIKPFCGKPIIAYPIKTALESKLFSRVIVSTDSQHIADIAASFGAEAPFLRPSSLSDDFTPTAAVARHAIKELGLDSSPNSSDVLCVIYPTAPLLRPESLKRALEMLLESHTLDSSSSPLQSPKACAKALDTESSGDFLDSGVLFSFAAVGYAYSPFRSFCIRGDDSASQPNSKKQEERLANRGSGEWGRVEMLFPQHFAKRSQDLAQVYHDAGQFYFGWAWAWERAWRDGLALFAPHSRALILRQHEAQDIDTLEDWTLAEMKYRAMTRI